MNIEINKIPDKDILLTEYEATLKSISHYERLIWTVGSIFNVIVAGSMGFALRSDDHDVLLIPIALSILLHIIWWCFEVRYRQINISKFRRIWELETILGMHANLYVINDDRTLKRKKPRAHYLILSICISFPAILILYYLHVRFNIFGLSINIEKPLEAVLTKLSLWLWSPLC